MVHKLLNKFFKYAESESYIAKKPLSGLRLPKQNEDEIDDDKVVETLTPDETKKIIAKAGHSKIRYLITFALLTGAREGEALEKTDIVDDVIKINKALKKLKVFDDLEGKEYHYEVKTTKPKTETSTRELVVNSALKKELKGLNKLIIEERLKLGPSYTENNLLFPSATGTYILPKSICTSWTRLLKRAGIEHKKFHSLRHTFATTLISEGVDILTVSRLLGHSSIETTQIYTHVLNDRKTDALSVLNDKFIKKKEPYSSFLFLSIWRNIGEIHIIC